MVAWTRSRNPSSPRRVAAGDERQWPRAPSTAPLGRPTSPASADSSGKTYVPWVSWRAMLHPWSRIHNTGERLRFRCVFKDDIRPLPLFPHEVRVSIFVGNVPNQEDVGGNMATLFTRHIVKKHVARNIDHGVGGITRSQNIEHRDHVVAMDWRLRHRLTISGGIFDRGSILGRGIRRWGGHG